MDEWDLQRELTEDWGRNGLQINGIRYVLIAWEVIIPEWVMNDSDTGNWGRPSRILDFLIVDEQFRLGVIEVKNIAKNTKYHWELLAQVTYSTWMVASTSNPDRLAQIYYSCWIQGYKIPRHGRLLKGVIREPDVNQHHQKFFQLQQPIQSKFDLSPLRIVAAREFKSEWRRILSESSTMTGKEFKQTCRTELTSKKMMKILPYLETVPDSAIDTMNPVQVLVLK